MECNQANDKNERAAARADVVPMCVAWNMMTDFSKRQVFILAGIPRGCFVPWVHVEWELMPPALREKVLDLVNYQKKQGDITHE